VGITPAACLHAPPTEMLHDVDRRRGARHVSVSTVMPAFNAERFIGEAINSVINQTVGDWELIVVDDGSTDQTTRIVSSYRDPRIRLVNVGQRGGQANARNIGTSIASHEFISYLDADDRLAPDNFATLRRALEKDPDAVLAYGTHVRIDETGKRYGTRRLISHMARPNGDVLTQFLCTNHMVNGGVALVRKSAVQRVGGFKPGLPCNDDWVLWAHLAAIGHFHHVPGYIALEYRELSTGITQTVSKTFEKRLPAIEAVYGNPMLRSRYSEQELARLRAIREANVLTSIACQMVRRDEWQKSWPHLWGAFKVVPHRLPVFALKYLAAIGDRIL
jgi:glycosyltransferase involved in cell wall biosynthesis